MARLPIPGGDDGTWGDILNEYLSQSLNVDGTLKSAALPDASAVTKGVVQLAGDLGGTATAPTVPGLSGKASAGVNSDITSLSGLTTALSIGQGGTGASTRQSAINNLTNSSAAANGDVLQRDASGNAVFAPAPGATVSGSDVFFPGLDYTTASIPSGSAMSFDIPWTLATATILVRQIRLEPSDANAVYDIKIVRQSDYTPAGLIANLAFHAVQIKGVFMREFVWDYEDENNVNQLHVWINNTGSYATSVRILLNSRVVQ